jgi:DNA-binding MarR family transcriptional regulator
MAEDGSFVNSDYRDQAAFRVALRGFDRSAEDHARAAGITPQQYVLLLTIRGHHAYPAVCIADIAASLQLRHHSSSLLVDRAVKRGLLDRKEDPLDRRRALVSLTREGQTTLDQVMVANRQKLGVLQEVLWRNSLHDALHVIRDGVAAE